MGRPVVMPDVNISHLFTDEVNAVLLRTGSAEEIADKCVGLFSNPQKADVIGRAGRLFAEQYFDVRCQAKRLEQVYQSACSNFNPEVQSKIWKLEKKVDDFRDVAAERDALVSIMLSSRSWKITRPLRVMSRLARSVQSFFIPPR